MPDDFDLIHVNDVAGFGELYGKAVEKKDDQKDRRKGRRERKERKPGDYFHAMAKAAEGSNEVLIQKNLPYRFCVYKEGDQVLIEMVVLDEHGTVTKTVKKNITQESFAKWIEDITKSEGLFFDTTA